MMLLNKQSKIESLCPICLKKIDASIFTEGETSYMMKTCPEHGTFKTVLWRGGIPMGKWVRHKERAYLEKTVTKVDKGCPYDCGLCNEHRQHTCTALIEVTQNCNLQCPFCFADSFAKKGQEPSLNDIRFQYQSVLRVSGTCNIQLSGGEPTVRNDLPEIIKMGVDLGFTFIQVNTNGIRMADDENYVISLKKAGLSSVFLQFDGTHDKIYRKLRGKALFEKKFKAIENCKKYGIGVVLVPTLVPGVNIDNIGEIIKFGIKHVPTVRGVHFQPVSYFGRMPKMPQDKDRITLPEVMTEISKQTDNMILVESMKPPGCENALCSFHGNYIIEENGLMQVTKRSSCCCATEKAEEGANKAKAFVARNWSYYNHNNKDKQQEDCSDWDKILKTIQKSSFSISAMAFQDAWNVNLERIKDCCIHVVTHDGRLIPFCMYNLTNAEGRSLYRN
ncbi:radical SAM (seleno)protein TrsS [Marinisporobacter balticus]|uniref:Radical SAM core domain-containing protein n=1 Tax=Marinisporobacter balticus TaxID=2018667 RepID=A0A4R2KFI3_9FIRM|nr:radical SAM (seleno)protein TrsS [Marinisporobacter balticus]TCO71824.1 hypothetical protein EV214_12044 [Marinisporobacter balticus]